MKKEDIKFGDWHRWLFGEAPPSFVGETALRAFLIFLLMVLIMRLMGRRMKGQMSVTELAVVLTLGAVIAGPMQIPTAGLLPSVAVLLALLFMHRFTNWLAFKSRRAELVQQMAPFLHSGGPVAEHQAVEVLLPPAGGLLPLDRAGGPLVVGPHLAGGPPHRHLADHVDGDGHTGLMGPLGQRLGCGLLADVFGEGGDELGAGVKVGTPG